MHRPPASGHARWPTRYGTTCIRMLMPQAPAGRPDGEDCPERPASGLESAVVSNQRRSRLDMSVTRRHFLHLVAVGSGAALLSACGSSAPAAPPPSAPTAAPQI